MNWTVHINIVRVAKGGKMTHYVLKRPVPKSMPKKEREMLIDVLRNIQHTARMENAHFYVFDKDGDEKMKEIRSVSKIWRESYIISPLERLIYRYETGKPEEQFYLSRSQLDQPQP